MTSAHLTLGMVRTLKAQGVKTLVFTTLLSRSTTVSVDALLAAEPDAPDETAVVWTHTGLRAALTIGGADHSARPMSSLGQHFSQINLKKTKK